MLQKKTEVPEVNSHLSSQSGISLSVHRNRTNFQHNDVLVPWKLNVKTKSLNCVQSESHPETFLRFYHVFTNGELEKLCSKIPDVSICRSFYDQGNWCVELVRK